MVMLGGQGERGVWIDCDPGHDDAIALLLAFFSGSSVDGRSDLQVLGVSTTHGNASGRDTFRNATRLLSAYGVGPEQCKVWRGSEVPLLRVKRQDVDIHGGDGLAGVECLPEDEDVGVREHMQSASSTEADPLGLTRHLIALLQERRIKGLPPISLIATGPLTNVALLLKMCPGDESLALLRETIAEIVIMGGAAATSGNRSPTAEWNILVDPEAAAIVFDCPIPVVMAGLNVTHQAIFTTALQDELMQIHSPLRRLINSAITFFSSTYRTVFGFQYGPPIHDMLAVAYVLDPSLFYALHPRQHAPPDVQAFGGQERVPCSRFRVEVDTSSGLTAGTTLVDLYEQWPVLNDGWGKGGRNVLVLEYVDTSRLWPLLFGAVERAERWIAVQQAEQKEMH